MSSSKVLHYALPLGEKDFGERMKLYSLGFLVLKFIFVQPGWRQQSENSWLFNGKSQAIKRKSDFVKIQEVGFNVTGQISGTQDTSCMPQVRTNSW